MRQVGLIENEQQAHQFVDYLVSEGIAAHTEREDGQWEIWVRDENHIQSALEELRQFTQNPEDPRYQGASQRASQMRQQHERRRREAQKNLIEMRSRWNRGILRRAPLVVAVIAISVVVTIAVALDQRLMLWLTFSRLDSMNFFRQIQQGQIWRLVTPAFIHFGIIHLAFDMYMFYYLGSQIEARFGTRWFGLLVLLIAAGSNAGQAYLAQEIRNQIVGASPFFGGMSGVDYGLFGYIWMKRVYAPQSGLYVSPGTVFLLLAWLVLCLLPGALGTVRVANGAHVVGLVLGMAFGYGPELLKGSQRR